MMQHSLTNPRIKGKPFRHAAENGYYMGQNKRGTLLLSISSPIID